MSWITEKFTLPIEYLKKAFVKQNLASNEEQIEVAECTIINTDETISESQFSLPLGQNHVNSTIIEAQVHRGGSIISDPTFVEQRNEEQTITSEEQIISQTLQNNFVRDNKDNKNKNIKNDKSPKNQKNCSHFLMGRCRHGFTGRKAFGDI